jgi:hypothetical protein
MREKSRSIFTMTVLLGLLVASAVLYGAAQQPRSSLGAHFSQLTLKITSTKEDFVELEPIPIIFNLSNETSQAIVGHSALELANNYVKLFIIEGNGELHEIQNLSPVTANTAAAPREISPGENLESKQALAFYLDQSFPHPGIYQIQAKLYDPGWTNEIRSNVLTIRVRAPKGQKLAALKYIKSLGASSYFFSGVGFGSKEQERAALENFIANFGDTVYADYANFSLGELYFYDKKFKNASSRFSLLESKTDFVFSDKARNYLERIRRENTISAETP